MSTRFAPTATQGRASAQSLLFRTFTSRALDSAANDNGSSDDSDLMLRAALRHFGEHGMGAARAARAQAESAFFAGDRQTYDWWIGITRTLDKRLASEAERTLGATFSPT